MGVAKKWAWSLFQKCRQVKLCSQCLKVTLPTLRYKLTKKSNGKPIHPPLIRQYVRTRRYWRGSKYKPLSNSNDADLSRLREID